MPGDRLWLRLEDLKSAIVRVASLLDEDSAEWLMVAAAVEPLLPWLLGLDEQPAPCLEAVGS